MTNLTQREIDLILKVFQNYYCEGIKETAEDNDTAESLFVKLGILDEDGEYI